MSTYEKCPKSVTDLSHEVLCEYPRHKPLLDYRVTVDYVFAESDKDEDGNPINDAIKHHGVKALAVARKTTLKQRALGLADAEICIDYDWWQEASVPEQKALLDHELYHLEVMMNEEGVMKDDLGRPKLKLRPHDWQFGWFNCIAHEHGKHSQEVQQARLLMDDSGQFYWDILALSDAAAKS